MADEITELCQRLLATEDAEEFHRRAAELRSAIAQRVEMLRKNAYGVRLAAQLASILSMYQAGQRSFEDRPGTLGQQSDDGESSCPPTADRNLTQAQSGAN